MIAQTLAKRRAMIQSSDNVLAPQSIPGTDLRLGQVSSPTYELLAAKAISVVVGVYTGVVPTPVMR